MTHDIFSMIAIHSALLGPQTPQIKSEYVRDAIRTYNKDLHRKILRVGPLENLWGAGELQKKYLRKGKLNETGQQTFIQLSVLAHAKRISLTN